MPQICIDVCFFAGQGAREETHTPLLWTGRLGYNGNMMKVALHNLGCKVNEYELEKMAASLQEAGFSIVPFAPGADVYVVNTCTVTHIADRKSRQMLHRAKTMDPDALVVAAGCSVNIHSEEMKKDPLIDFVLSNEEKAGIARFLLETVPLRADSPASDETGGPGKADEAEVPGGAGNRRDAGNAAGTENTGIEHTRAFVKIQDGCNAFCSYCLIPYARGRERSRPEEEILREIRERAEAGQKEIVLTGIHISKYGADTGTDLARLITGIGGIPGVERIRIGSLEPGIVTPAFLKAMADVPAFCPQFHLSLQSGSDTVLARMNRHYTTEEYAGKCALIREFFPDAGITTDIIAGFPGETDEEWRETVRFARRIAFSRIHVFRYSKRAGTRAAKMPDQVPENVKAARSEELIAQAEKDMAAFAERFVGRTVKVLLEEEKDGAYTGYTPEYVPVTVASQGALSGTIVEVVPDRAEKGTLTAVLSDPGAPGGNKPC